MPDPSYCYTAACRETVRTGDAVEGGAPVNVLTSCGGSVFFSFSGVIWRRPPARRREREARRDCRTLPRSSRSRARRKRLGHGQGDTSVMERKRKEE